eukprot:9148406-Pyramimonas_sp.AAC.1
MQRHLIDEGWGRRGGGGVGGRGGGFERICVMQADWRDGGVGPAAQAQGRSGPRGRRGRRGSRSPSATPPLQTFRARGGCGGESGAVRRCGSIRVRSCTVG